jgi:hypothetical protein
MNLVPHGVVFGSVVGEGKLLGRRAWMLWRGWMLIYLRDTLSLWAVVLVQLVQ